MGAKIITNATKATTSRDGIVRLSVAPVDAQAPIAIADNDPRLTRVRGTGQVTTGTLAASATENASIALSRTTELLVIATDYPAWVRVYSTAAARTADATRDITQDIEAGKGLQAEVITRTGALSIPMSPAPVVCNLDTPATTTLYLAITNLDTVARAITATFTHLKLED